MKSARTMGWKLLQRRRVNDELVRRLPDRAKAKRRGELIELHAKPIEGEIQPGDPLPTDADRGLFRQLSREWTVARLMRNARICLGELEQASVRIVTRTGANGETKATAIQIKAFVHDAAGANAALAQLMKELERRERDGQTLSNEPAQLPHRVNFERRMAVFAATCCKRQAEWAERAARAKGDSNDVAANPQKCA